MSVAIVGVMVVSATATFGSIARARRVQVESRLGTLLAQQLMTEILQQPFARSSGVFGAVAGQTRSIFDSVDAYDGYSASPPVSQGGTTLTDYANWTESVAVTYADLTTLAASGSATTLKKVTVTVTSPGGKPYVLIGMRSKLNTIEQVPSAQTTYVTGVAVSVQGASPTRTVYGGAHPMNLTSSQ